jgi:PKD repeat protein
MLMGAFAVAGLTVSCQSSPLTAPQGTTITFLSGTTMIATGSIDVVVNVIQGGQSTGTGPNATAPTGGQPVHDNTAVFFTTTLGTIVPAQAKTTNGLATVTLVGDGRTGTAKIVASSGSVTGNTSVTVTASTVSNVSISLPGSAGVVSTPANFTVGVGASTGIDNVTVDFGDGSIQSVGAIATNATATATHLYTAPGTYQVVATASGSDGGSATSSTTVAISPLTLTPSGPATIAAGASGSYAVTPTTGAFIDHYEWDFGDGTVISTSSNTQTHVYISPGTRTVTVVVVPAAGASRLVTMQVQIT